MHYKVTKNKIRQYLFKYYKLKQMIHEREQQLLLGRGPDLDEWIKGRNTIEDQAISLIEDKKIQEYQFYKNILSKYLKLLSNLHYKYIKLKYFKQYDTQTIRKILGYKDLNRLDNDVISYLQNNLIKEENNEYKAYKNKEQRRFD